MEDNRLVVAVEAVAQGMERILAVAEEVGVKLPEQGRKQAQELVPDMTAVEAEVRHKLQNDQYLLISNARNISKDVIII